MAALFEDLKTPEERFREYDELESSIRKMQKLLEETPEAFPEGISLPDKENDWDLVMYADEDGTYASYTTGGKTYGITVEEMIELAKRNYLGNHAGLALLLNAVARSGKEKVLHLGNETITIFPTLNGLADYTWFDGNGDPV